MKRTRLAMAAACMTLGTTGLAACGGGNDDSGSSSASTSAPTTSTAAPATTSTATSPPKTGAGGITPVGSTLKIGQAAVIKYTDYGPPQRISKVQVTPVSMKKGSIADFKNMGLDAKQKAATPYYVKVTLKNLGPKDLTGTDPIVTLDGLDDRDQEQSQVIFFGDFDTCPSADKPKSLKPGESYSSCETYLIPKGGSMIGVKWTAFDPKTPDKSDIIWKP